MRFFLFEKLKEIRERGRSVAKYQDFAETDSGYSDAEHTGLRVDETNRAYNAKQRLKKSVEEDFKEHEREM